MEKIIRLNFIAFFIIISSYTPLHSQQLSIKYGKVTMDELTMSVYQKDTTANAVVLYDMGNTYYSLSNGHLISTTEYSKKIKILKQEGVDEANIEIPYYNKSSDEREMLSNIEAIAYNLENGKIVKTKLEKKYIFDEELSNRYRRTKFSISNVKIGSVIEIKFNKTSNLLYNIDTWKIQGEIPVIYSFYEIKIPEYFLFNVETRGFENIKVVETPENQQFDLGSTANGPNLITCTSRNIKYTAIDVPALKDEAYVWCVNDYLSAVRFELKATHFPNEFYKPFSQTWEDLEKYLKDSDFGQNLKMSNPYKDEIKSLIATTQDDEEKIGKIYKFVKEKIRWNEKYAFYGNKTKEMINQKTGDNSQINMLLLSILKDVNIKAYPVLISRRTHGRLPFTYPSYEMLNTFIVAAQTSDKKTFYMDGSATNGGLNSLPEDLLVDRGRVYCEDETEKWVNLTEIARNQKILIIQATMNSSGTITGNLSTGFSFQEALNYKQRFQAAKDSAEFIDKFQNDNQIVVDSFKITGKDPLSNLVKEEIKFTKTYEDTGGFIYLNPMLFTHITENKFTQSDRKLPIEFNYPNSFILNCNITIPDNYQIVEIPKSIRITLNDKCKCIYHIQQEGNKLNLSYRFDKNQTIFPFTDYGFIKEYFGQISTKNQELVILKKI